MPDYESLYPGRFLKGRTLESPKTIRLTAVAPTTLEGDKGEEAKAVVKYRGADGTGELVLCKTNAILIEAITGIRDYEKWVGHLVTIRFDPTVKFGKETVGGIRVCGSPELKSTKRVEVKRPRRKTLEVYVLEPTDAQGRVRQPSAKPAVAAPPAATAAPPDDDPDAWMRDSTAATAG